MVASILAIPLFFLIICKVIVNSIVQISVVVLLVLSIYVLDLRIELYDSLVNNHLHYLCRPFVAVFIAFIKVTNSGIEGGQDD